MQCGKQKNNGLIKLFKFCLVSLIVISGAFSAACQSKPKDAAAILAPCQQQLDKDDIQNVGECYQNALAANPKQTDEIEELFNHLFYKKCVEFKERKNYKQAIICFEGADALRPDGANAKFQLADSYFEFNETKTSNDFDMLDRAQQLVEAGLEVKPKDMRARFLLGNILERKGNLSEALKVYQELVSVDSKTDIFWLRMAVVQEKLGDLSAAITSCKQVLLFKPNSTLALYHLAKLSEKMGNKDQAIKNYEKLLEIENEYDDARERLNELKKSKKSKPSKEVTESVAFGPAH